MLVYQQLEQANREILFYLRCVVSGIGFPLGYLVRVLCALSREHSITLLLVAVVAHSVQTQLSSLSEGFSATINTANIRSLISVNVLVLLLVLLQSKLFVAEPARELLLAGVSDSVPLQGKLSTVLFAATRVRADELFAGFVVAHIC